jgi:hypothetical protein
VELFQLLLGYRGGGVGHQVDGFGGFGEGNDFAQAGRAGKQHDDAVEAQRDAAVRRRAVFERVQEEAENARASSSLIPSEAKICCCTSLRWIRMEPEPSSRPFIARS